MIYAFVDESERGSSYFFLSALLVEEKNTTVLHSKLDSLIHDISTTPGSTIEPSAELHGYDMMQQKWDWKGMPLRLASSCYRQALEITAELGAALYVEGLDREKQERIYRYPYPPREVTISYLLERINEYCVAHNEQAKVIFDDHYTAPEGRKDFLRMKERGTFGYKSSKLPSITEIEFCDSRRFRCLQASDLCCYIVNRSVTCTTQSAVTLEHQAIMRRKIEPLIQRGRLRIWP